MFTFTLCCLLRHALFHFASVSCCCCSLSASQPSMQIRPCMGTCRQSLYGFFLLFAGAPIQRTTPRAYRLCAVASLRCHLSLCPHVSSVQHAVFEFDILITHSLALNTHTHTRARAHANCVIPLPAPARLPVTMLPCACVACGASLLLWRRCCSLFHFRSCNVPLCMCLCLTLLTRVCTCVSVCLSAFLHLCTCPCPFLKYLLSLLQTKDRELKTGSVVYDEHSLGQIIPALLFNVTKYAHGTCALPLALSCTESCLCLHQANTG